MRLVDRGEIPYHRVGSHRRLRVEDVLGYRELLAGEVDWLAAHLCADESPGGTIVDISAIEAVVTDDVAGMSPAMHAVSMDEGAPTPVGDRFWGRVPAPPGQLAAAQEQHPPA